ncbi:MAG: hypothetical protein FJ290_25195 [Planctomycetes bacterium]|nr:hypothetical protein [Planctomycetota bacterium]
MEPFEGVWSWYQYAGDSIRLAAQQVEADPDSIPPGLVFSQHASPQEALSNLAKARAELNDLMVLVLFAVFEQALRGHLAQTSADAHRSVSSETQASLVSGAFKRLEKCSLEQLLALYRNVVEAGLLKPAQHVKAYRNWVAHGKKEPRPAEVPEVAPAGARDSLTRFLRALGL